jgi:biotin carboxyl carrier protein
MITPKNQKSRKVKVNSTKKITELYNFMLEQNIEEMELKDKNSYVKLRRRTKKSIKPSVSQDSTGTPVVDTTPKGMPVKSPLNGIFYRAASPQSAPFVKEGDVVEQEAVLCIVEAMKVMNEIRAERKYKVLKILIENGKSVNADQNMFLVEPA